jgi:hypothetical protein
MSRQRRRTIFATALAFVIGVAVAATASSFGAFSALAPASFDPGSLGRFFLGKQLVRAEIATQNGTVLHDWRVDQGRVRSASGGTLKLKERNGDLVTVSVAPNATIRVNGRTATLAQVRPGATALTIRDGGVTAPATIVRATTR